MKTTSPELKADAMERNTPRSNLLAAIKSLAARSESHPKEWGPAQVKSSQLEAISTFERAICAASEQEIEDLNLRLDHEFQRAIDFELKAEQAEQKLDEVYAVLKHLKAEVAGMISYAERDLRDVLGSTNLSVLKLRVEEADAALAKKGQR